jgi:hypothetical protein
MPINIDILSPHFDCQNNKGWLTVCTRNVSCRKHFGTNRLAKLMPNDELVFTIGATQSGVSVRLSNVIESYIGRAGFTVLDRRTTAGGREAHYPACDIRNEPLSKILRVLRDVEREVKRIAEDLDV